MFTVPYWTSSGQVLYWTSSGQVLYWTSSGQVLDERLLIRNLARSTIPCPIRVQYRQAIYEEKGLFSGPYYKRLLT